MRIKSDNNTIEIFTACDTPSEIMLSVSELPVTITPDVAPRVAEVADSLVVKALVLA
jgi:hypothetical protein